MPTYYCVVCVQVRVYTFYSILYVISLVSRATCIHLPREGPQVSSNLCICGKRAPSPKSPFLPISSSSSSSRGEGWFTVIAVTHLCHTATHSCSLQYSIRTVRRAGVRTIQPKRPFLHKKFGRRALILNEEGEGRKERKEERAPFVSFCQRPLPSSSSPGN